MTRASDSDREAVQAQLRASCLAGRISVEELERRVDRAMRAQTVSELGGLLADLPSRPPRAPLEPDQTLMVIHGRATRSVRRHFAALSF